MGASPILNHKYQTCLTETCNSERASWPGNIPNPMLHTCAATTKNNNKCPTHFQLALQNVNANSAFSAMTLWDSQSSVWSAFQFSNQYDFSFNGLNMWLSGLKVNLCRGPATKVLHISMSNCCPWPVMSPWHNPFMVGNCDVLPFVHEALYYHFWKSCSCP